MLYDYVVFIGRFQPFHKIHLQTCKLAAKQGKHLIIFVGSSFTAPNIRNPFTFEQRRNLIEQVFEENQITNYTIFPIRDYFYSDNAWVADVQQKVSMITNPNSKIALIGHQKDYTSYYLSLFPQWKFINTKDNIVDSLKTDSTTVRNCLFKQANPSKHSCTKSEYQKIISNLVDKPVVDFLKKFTKTDQYNHLVYEFEKIQDYKDAWKDTPYPPTFVTTDAVVVCGGHILLVRRKGHPGNGLLALPGGFIQEYEKIQDSCLRELKEETRIKVPLPVLKGSIKDSKTFDHPLRSVRGRTITHAFYLELENEKDLPKVKGSDDAEKAVWVPLNEFAAMSETMFEDHYAIVESFVGRLM